MLGGTPTAPDVIQHQYIPNWMDTISKGVDIGAKLAALPREGAENATQIALQQIAKEQAKANQQAYKQIMKQYADNPVLRAQALNELNMRTGAPIISPAGASTNPSLPSQVYGPGYILQNPLLDVPQIVPKTTTPQPQTPQTPEQPKSQMDSQLDNFTSSAVPTVTPQGFGLEPALFLGRPQYQSNLTGGALAPAPIA